MAIPTAIATRLLAEFQELHCWPCARSEPCKERQQVAYHSFPVLEKARSSRLGHHFHHRRQLRSGSQCFEFVASFLLRESRAFPFESSAGTQSGCLEKQRR